MFAGCVAKGRMGQSSLAGETTDPDRRGDALADALLGRLAPLHDPDVVGRYVRDGAVLAQALNWNTPESRRETVPTVCPHTGNVLISWMRLDNRESLARELGMSASEGSAMTDPELVLAGYRRWGTETARRLAGDFALAIFEPASGRVYLARDPMGIRPLYYAEGHEAFAFATTLACFHEIDWVDSTPSQKWLAFYLAGLSDSVTGLVAFAGVTEVLPGHHVVVEDGAAAMTRYHQFRDDPLWRTATEPRFVDEYREEFLHAVGARMRSAYPIGAENSGGLDSASIIGVIRELGGRDAAVETFGMPQYVDDERFMRVAVEGTGFGLHVFDRSGAGMLDAAVDAARIIGHPPEADATYFWRPFVQRAAALGVRTILSGNGGDDAVTIDGDLLYRELALHWEWRLLGDYRYGRSARGRWRALRSMVHERRRDRERQPLRDVLMGDLESRGLTTHALEDLGVRAHVEEAGPADGAVRHAQRVHPRRPAAWSADPAGRRVVPGGLRRQGRVPLSDAGCRPDPTFPLDPDHREAEPRHDPLLASARHGRPGRRLDPGGGGQVRRRAAAGRGP